MNSNIMSNNGTSSTTRNNDHTNNEIGDGKHRRDESNNDANKKQKTSKENEYIDEGTSDCLSVIFLICLWFVDCFYAHQY